MKKRLARVVLRSTGWTIDGSPPPYRKYVVIAAPHTSNWDLFYLLVFSWYHGVRISWLAKDTLFPGVAGWVMRRLGGIPVRRDQRSGLVNTLVAEFAAADELVVVIPPEGTRTRTDHWKSGFYRVAVAAGVPIVCVYLDYDRRAGGFGPVLWPSGDVDADLAELRSFYADKRGKYPDQMSEIRFRAGD